MSEGGVQVVNVIADLFMPVGIDPDGIIDLVWDDNGAIVTATINAAGDLITFMSTGPTSFDSKDWFRSSSTTSAPTTAAVTTNGGMNAYQSRM